MILGISVDENFVYVTEDSGKETYSLPFSIGRNLSTKTWFIGEEARNENVDNVDLVITVIWPYVHTVYNLFFYTANIDNICLFFFILYK